eukprot:15157005-Alexandrium_andersonii.AAC.1
MRRKAPQHGSRQRSPFSVRSAVSSGIGRFWAATGTLGQATNDCPAPLGAAVGELDRACADSRGFRNVRE